MAPEQVRVACVLVPLLGVEGGQRRDHCAKVMRRVALVLVGALTLVPPCVAARAALTPAQYHVRATAICVRTHDKIAGLPMYGKVGTRKQMIQYLTAALPIQKGYVIALRRLQPPTQLKAMHDGVVSDEAAQLALTTRFRAKLKVTTNAGFRAAVERWGAAAMRISSDEKWRLVALHLTKCI
jgi:hypothetical protein